MDFNVSHSPNTPAQIPLEVDVIIEHEGWQELGNMLGDLEELTQQALHAVIHTASFTVPHYAQVCFLFSDDATIKQLNRDFRAIDKPTNVLSFPSVPSPHNEQGHPLGDVILAYETMKREAIEEGKSLKDHTLHLIIHGFLHLNGFDHETQNEAEFMESAEIKALAHLGVVNPYEGRMISESKT
jgi:probable rRNA maturation factor